MSRPPSTKPAKMPNQMATIKNLLKPDSARPFVAEGVWFLDKFLRTIGPRIFYRRGDDTESYYWIVTVAVPVSQVPDVVVDAVTVGEPCASRVASPGVVVENVSNVVSLEVQVELFVT